MKKILLIGIIILLVLVSAGIGGGVVWLFTKKEKAPAPVISLPMPTLSPTKSSITSNKEAIELVSRHMILPSENPTVVIVNNAQMLAQAQGFFHNAKDGNIVLVYSQKVILYDPNLDKIVEVAYIAKNR